MLVGDADDERLLSGENGVMRLGHVGLALLRTSRVWRAIINSSLVGMTHAATRLEALEMRGPCSRVRLRVELDAEPGGLAAHALADCDGALADAGGEDERVEPAERRGERAQLAPMRYEELHRQLARGSADSSSTRMSLETPETPSRPDCW